MARATSPAAALILQQRVVASDRANAQLHQKMLASERDAVDLKREVHAKHAQVLALEGRLRDAEVRICDMQAAVDAAGGADRRMRLLRAQRDEALAELARSRELLLAELELERQQNRKLVAELEALGAQATQATLATLFTELQALEAALAAMAERLGGTQAELAQARSEEKRLTNLALWLQEQLSGYSPSFARVHAHRTGLGAVSADAARRRRRTAPVLPHDELAAAPAPSIGRERRRSSTDPLPHPAEQRPASAAAMGLGLEGHSRSITCLVDTQPGSFRAAAQRRHSSGVSCASAWHVARLEATKSRRSSLLG